MYGSEAETRIRDKTAALMRDLWPDGRLINEFDLGGVRIDLAMVTPERMVLAEIKSERDTLSRLARQVRTAMSLGGEVWLVIAERWEADLKRFGPSQDYNKPIPLKGGGNTYAANPDHIPGLYSIQTLVERGGDTPLEGYNPNASRPDRDRYNNRHLLTILMKPEVLRLAQPFGGKSRMTSDVLMRLAHENLTGAEIRRGTMAAIRARPHFWADPVVPWRESVDIAA